MAQSYLLTKSKYIRGLQCDRALWLDVYNPKLARYTTEQMRRFDRGREFEYAFKDTFPNGIDISAELKRNTDAYPALTAQLLDNNGVQARIQFHRIEQDSVKTTARVEKTYTVSGSRKCDYYVSYYFYVDDSLYHGETQLKKSVWEKFAPHDPIEIAYEKGNPSNSSWAGYHKD